MFGKSLASTICTGNKFFLQNLAFLFDDIY